MAETVTMNSSSNSVVTEVVVNNDHPVETSPTTKIPSSIVRV